MKWLNNLSFVQRIVLAMVCSFMLNLTLDYHLKRQLSQNDYILEVNAVYDTSSTMEMHFDTGENFNRVQEVVQVVRKGENEIQFPFKIENEGQLKFLRLDFGNEAGLSEVRLKNLTLRAGNDLLFDLSEKKIVENTGLLNGTELSNSEGHTYKIVAAEQSFDPYVVFNPINELIYPLWQRTLILVVPWLMLLFFPVLKWIRDRFKQKEFALLFLALFMASIPLKIAWVTFTSLLLLGHSLIMILKTRDIDFSWGRLAVMGLFLVPLLFIGQGKLSALAIPLGFVLFPIIFSLADFSKLYVQTKEIYTKVFFVICSIITVSWLLYMGFRGNFYNIELSNYFSGIKSNAHFVMDWLYYPHTTFLSFFILIGGIFTLDLYKMGRVPRVEAFAYAGFATLALLILGSRFAWVSAVLLSILWFIDVKYLKMILVPLWAALFAGTIYFIDKMDILRTELWQMAFASAKERVWFGHGTGTSGQILPSRLVFERNGSDAVMEINHAHNQFLTYLLENGLLGTLLITILCLFILYQYSKLNNKVMLLVTFSILLLMVVESPFKTATPLYLFSFLWSCFFGFSKKEVSK